MNPTMPLKPASNATSTGTVTTSPPPFGCQSDAFLTRVLKQPVWQVKNPADLSYPLSAGMYCAKVSAPDIRTAKLLTAKGFYLVDTNITLSSPRLTKNPAQKSRADIRPATPQDAAAVENIARHAFSQTRFHQDPALTKNEANEIKAQWVTNFFSRERGDYLFVATIKNVIAGFILLIGPRDDILTIDLLAVDEKYRGRGLGLALVSYACAAIPKVQEIRVGTQLSNLASLKVYQRAGFTFLSAHYIFHYHQTNAH